MKTLHLSLAVKNLEESIAYYENLFGQKPDVIKPGFAKWWLDDPRLNFALGEATEKPGLNHLGIQVSEEKELNALMERARGAGPFLDQGDTTCCYARSIKAWSSDPQDIPWELFLTTEHLHDQADEDAPMEIDAPSPPVTRPTACC